MDEENNEFDLDDTGLRYLAYASRIKNIAVTGTRYLAYTSDLGEAFRPVVSQLAVKAAYGVSFAYVGIDVAYELYKSRTRGDSYNESGRVFTQRTIFQGLASLLLPAITIHTAVDIASKQAKKFVNYPRLARFGPTGLGLAIIPMLPVMYDEPLEGVMDKFFDRIWPVSAEAKIRMHHHHHHPTE